jgi:predicted HTH domain antitoxin
MNVKIICVYLTSTIAKYTFLGYNTHRKILIIARCLIMTEQNISVSMPSDLYAELGNVPSFHGTLQQKLQLNLAIGMFIAKEVSLARAAEYAGMSLSDFSELLNGFGVPVVNYSEDMLADDLAFIRGMDI